MRGSCPRPGLASSWVRILGLFTSKQISSGNFLLAMCHSCGQVCSSSCPWSALPAPRPPVGRALSLGDCPSSSSLHPELQCCLGLGFALEREQLLPEESLRAAPVRRVLLCPRCPAPVELSVDGLGGRRPGAWPCPQAGGLEEGGSESDLVSN